MKDWEAVAEGIATALGRSFAVRATHAVGGGCINEAVCLEGERGERFFVKLNRAELLPMFEAEAAGLEAILDTRSVRAPRPLAQGIDAGQCWLALEYIDFGAASPDSAALLGAQLALMHRATFETFGWHRDNTIGSTPQPNTPGQDWVSFWRDQRLGFQLGLASERGAPVNLLKAGDRLLDALPALFNTYKPAPSLLHGDLWGGNWAADSDGNPVIFDPAVYYGDREADLAMTELFGGFSDRFYHSYRDCWDIDPGYTTRKVLYKLYHVLNHFNLFGGGYARQAQDMVDELLSNL